MPNGDALTAKDVADILHIGRNAIYELAKSGELGSYRIGRRLRFTYADVQSYIASTRGRGMAKAAFSPSQAKEKLIICGQDIILDVLSNYVFAGRDRIASILCRELRCAYRALQGRGPGGIVSFMGWRNR